jgi:proteasome lid subunit RPN8/RPN11
VSAVHEASLVGGDDRGGWGEALAAAFAHAAEAYPREACGVLVRGRGRAAIRDAAAEAIGAAATEVPAEARRWPHAVTTGEHFSLERFEDVAELDALCATGREVAVYHSHPDGRAVWSRSDAAVWTTPLGPSWPVGHVVIAVGAGGVTAATGLSWSAAAARFIERWRWEAA